MGFHILFGFAIPSESTFIFVWHEHSESEAHRIPALWLILAAASVQLGVGRGISITPTSISASRRGGFLGEPRVANFFHRPLSARDVMGSSVGTPSVGMLRLRCLHALEAGKATQITFTGHVYCAVLCCHSVPPHAFRRWENRRHSLLHSS